MVEVNRQLLLKDILNEKQIHHILNKTIGEDITWVLKWSEVKPAMEGIAGFLGDHLRAALYLDVKGEEKKVHLFMKRLPVNNKPKAEFIDAHNFYRRERLMFKLLEEIHVDDLNPWCVTAYIYTDSIIVMPDLAFEGYSSRHFLDTLDYEHVFLSTTAIARFHAAFVNYETKKSVDLKHSYSTPQKYQNILVEPTFCDSPFMRSCAKLSSNILKTFSTKGYGNVPDLESKLIQLYIHACDSLTEYKETLNVLLHRDIWVNNILFKHENDVPVNAVLVDYQCLRYGPPAFDLVMFLYLTTDREFRQKYEQDIFGHYYSVFVENLNNVSKKRLEDLEYDKDSFLDWCKKARMLGMLQAIAIYPFILMDPKTAQKTFDDPKTYDKYINEDRSEPVIAHANRCEAYKYRNLAVTEEFVESYVLNNSGKI